MVLQRTMCSWQQVTMTTGVVLPVPILDKVVGTGQIALDDMNIVNDTSRMTMGL